MRTNRIVFAAAAASVALPFMPSAGATPANVNQVVDVPVHVGLTTTVDCSNSPGPTITINGAITIGSVTTAVWFQNNTKGTHSTSPTVTTGDVGVVPSTQDGSDTLQIAKPPVPLTGGGWLGGSVGAGGNPWISFDVTGQDDAGNSVSKIGGAQLIGKCVQLGKGNVTTQTTKDFTIPVQVRVVAQSFVCSKDASTLTVTSNPSFSGLTGEILFDNNKNYKVHEAAVSGSAGFDLVDSYSASKGWGVGGAGGNPLTYVQFMGPGETVATNTDGTYDISGWTTYPAVNVGRCNQLG